MINFKILYRDLFEMKHSPKNKQAAIMENKKADEMMDVLAIIKHEIDTANGRQPSTQAQIKHNITIGIDECLTFRQNLARIYDYFESK